MEKSLTERMVLVKKTLAVRSREWRRSDTRRRRLNWYSDQINDYFLFPYSHVRQRPMPVPRWPQLLIASACTVWPLAAWSPRPLTAVGRSASGTKLTTAVRWTSRAFAGRSSFMRNAPTLTFYTATMQEERAVAKTCQNIFVHVSVRHCGYFTSGRGGIHIQQQ